MAVTLRKGGACLASKGHEVVLAETEYLNVSYHDNPVVAVREESVVHNVLDADLVALGHKQQRLGIT